LLARGDNEVQPAAEMYLNVDTEEAAQDMAFFWYSLWNYPLDTPLYWRVLCFNRRIRRPWEGVGAC